jgi:hypothetical protein
VKTVVRDAVVITVRVPVYTAIRSFADSSATHGHPWNQPVKLTLSGVPVLLYEKLGRWRLYVFVDGKDSLVARLESARSRKLVEVYEREEGVRVLVYDGSEKIEVSGEDVKRAVILPEDPYKVAGEPRPISLNHVVAKITRIYVRRALEAVKGG